mmetsp:Transcript_107695/g.214001  ORF Transcript_107695/g.214001 Transcript_107695/m.214001 type:complete len:239 (+) Transcript_107695:74-790(+)
MGNRICGAEVPEALSLPASVILHVYDVTTNLDVVAINRVLRPIGSGAFHCGVEVYGKEWSFRRSSNSENTGIFWVQPQSCPGASYCEAVAMGSTSMPHDKVSKLLTAMSREWLGNSYSLLKRNCCHFCDQLCKQLGVGAIPSWVTHLAKTGAAIIDEGLAAEDKIMALDKHVTQEVKNLDHRMTDCVTKLDRKVTKGVLEVDRQMASWFMGSVSCGTEAFLFGESAREDGTSKVQWIP